MRSNDLPFLRSIMVAAVIWLGAAWVTAAADTTAYRQYVPLQVAVDQEQLIAMPLDQRMYQETAQDFRDLRIIDERGREVSYLLNRRAETVTHTRQRFHTTGVKSLDLLDDDRLAVIVDVPESIERATALRIDTPLTDYQKTVTVYGRERASDPWQELAVDAVIFDYSRFADVRQSVVAFPATGARELRIVLSNIVDVQESPLMKLSREYRGDQPLGREEILELHRRPFRIAGAAVGEDIELQEVKRLVVRDYTVAQYDIVEHQSPNRTEITVTTHREPLTSFRLAVEDSNFRRAVEVRVPKRENKREVNIAESEISRLRYRDFEKQQTSVEFDEHRATEFILTIMHQDSQPLHIQDVLAEGHVYLLVFLAQPGRRYQLYYGASDAPKPSYDITAVKTLLAKGFDPVIITPGEVAENPDYSTSPRRFLSRRAVFIAGIVFMVIGLAWALYSAARKSGEPA